MAPELPSVAVLLLNYNGWQDTIECLESLLLSEYENFNIVVVDNLSPNDSMSELQRWAEEKFSERSISDFAQGVRTLQAAEFRDYRAGSHCSLLTLIQSGENRGFAAGNNCGLAYLSNGADKYVWMLNNDTVVEPSALHTLVDHARDQAASGRKVGITGSKLMYYGSQNVIQSVGCTYNRVLGIPSGIGSAEVDRGQFDNPSIADVMDFPVGASMFVSADFVRDIGGLCEDYFLYYEELDWCLRGRARGWQIGYCWSVRVWHKDGASIGSNTSVKGRSALADFHGIRSRMIFVRKFYPSYLPLIWLANFMLLGKRACIGQWTRIGLLARAMVTK